MTCSNLFGLFQLLGNLCFCEDIFVLERLSNASQSMKTLKKLIYLYFAYIASFTGLGSKDSKIKILSSWDSKFTWNIDCEILRSRDSWIARFDDREIWRCTIAKFDDRVILTIARFWRSLDLTSSIAKIKNSVDSSFPRKLSRVSRNPDYFWSVRRCAKSCVRR